jgi:PEP-CTERM motif
MRILRAATAILVLLVCGAAFACADIISYTFTGEGGDAGTDWTLVDPNGFIPNDTNVVGLLTASTDFFSFGVDYGPLIGIDDLGEQSGISVCSNAGTSCFDINMAINNPFGGSGPYLIPYFFAGNDGTTGTFTEIQNGVSTLTVTDQGPSPAPEPSSMLLVGTALLCFGGTLRRRFV